MKNAGQARRGGFSRNARFPSRETVRIFLVHDFLYGAFHLHLAVKRLVITAQAGIQKASFAIEGNF